MVKVVERLSVSSVLKLVFIFRIFIVIKDEPHSDAEAGCLDVPIYEMSCPTVNSNKLPTGICSCMTCGLVCNNKTALRKHMLDIHPELMSFCCNECSERFHEKQILRRHLQRSLKLGGIVPIFQCAQKHGDLKCNICNKLFSNKWTRKMHRMTIHDKIYVGICKYCGKGFSSMEHLITHERKHTGERPYICDVCGKAYISSFCLNEHKLRHMEVGKFECDICQKKFKVRVDLRQHRNIHFKESRIYSCNVCGYTHYSRSVIEKHKVTHVNYRPFECPICKKTFTSKDNLRKHKKATHDEDKGTFICTVCSKNFSSQSTLKRHQRIHTGVRPHECDICHQKFVVLDALKTHRLLKHKILPYECTTCGLKFKIKSDMIEHSYDHRNMSITAVNRT
jgi:KRAB domain-containing zinc finger protein